MIENINKLRQECLESFSGQVKSAEEVIDACKMELKEVKGTFESFEMCDKNFEEVLPFKKINSFVKKTVV